MTKLLLIAAGLGLAMSGANACEFQRSAQAAELDKTVVASIAVPQSEPVVVPEASTQMPQQVESTAK